MSKVLGILAVVCVVVYGSFLFYPTMVCRNSQSYQNITIHSCDPLTGDIETLLAKVHNKLLSSSIYNAETPVDIYLMGPGAYRMFGALCKGSYACTDLVRGRVFIKSADIEKNEAYDQKPEGTPRQLDGVMAHESVKGLLRQKMKFLEYLMLPDWKKDGYAETVARETADLSMEMFCSVEAARQADIARYLQYRLGFEIIKEEDKLAFDGAMNTNYSWESVSKRVRVRHCQ